MLPKVPRTKGVPVKAEQTCRDFYVPEAKSRVHARTEATVQPCSAYDLSCQLGECLFDAFARLGAGTQNSPIFCRQSRFHLRIEFPLGHQVALIDYKNKGNLSDLFVSPLFQGKSLFESSSARAVFDKKIAGGALKIGPANLLKA